MKVSSEISDKYGKCIKLLGNGTFGTVYATSHGFALKIIETCDLSFAYPSESGIVEYSCMSSVFDPYLMPILDLFIEPQYIYIVMPLGEVVKNDISSTMAKDEIKRIFTDMCLGLAALHKADIAHRDIKLENYIKINDRVVLTDFGISKPQMCVEYEKLPLAFTLHNRPPEYLIKSSSGKEGDIWALGVILLTLESGSLPFKSDNDIGMLEEIFLKLGMPSREKWSDIVNYVDYVEGKHYDTTYFKDATFLSPDVKRLLQKMLVFNPKDRATIYEILHDPYFDLSDDILNKYKEQDSASAILLSQAVEFKRSELSDRDYLNVVCWITEVKNELKLSNYISSYAIYLFNIMISNMHCQRGDLLKIVIMCLHTACNFYDDTYTDIMIFLNLTSKNIIINDIYNMFLKLNKILYNNLIIAHPYLFAIIKVNEITAGLKFKNYLLPILTKVMDILLISTIPRKLRVQDIGYHAFQLALNIYHKKEIAETHSEVTDILKQDEKDRIFRTVLIEKHLMSTFQAIIN